jgi:hypothetical protein
MTTFSLPSVTAAATQFMTLRNEQVLRREPTNDELEDHDAEAEHVGPGRDGNTQLQLMLRRSSDLSTLGVQKTNMVCANYGALTRGKKP